MDDDEDVYAKEQKDIGESLTEEKNEGWHERHWTEPQEFQNQAEACKGTEAKQTNSTMDPSPNW